MSDGLVEVGLKIASFTFGPLIALFLLVRVKDRLALQLSSQLLVTSLFISLISTVCVSIFLKPAMAYLIPTGVVVFYTMVGVGQIGKKSMQS